MRWSDVETDDEVTRGNREEQRALQLCRVGGQNMLPSALAGGDWMEFLLEPELSFS